MHSDDRFTVLQTSGDVGDVVVHPVGVSNAQVTHDHNQVVTHGNFRANLQLPGEHRQVLLDEFLVLETQFSCIGEETVRCVIRGLKCMKVRTWNNVSNGRCTQDLS